jgi:aryl-alcohol dehydrogenase-like predicted oxidoreductase
VIYRKLGDTGLEISAVGYGAWGIGGTMWLGADDDESLTALRRAVELGVNFIDTAAGYGNGHSEELVGRVVRESADTLYVSTKIPPKNLRWPAPAGVPAEDAYPRDWVVSQTEASLERLGLETIDVQQFHVWSDEWVGHGSWLDAVEELKQAGKIRHFGVSINDHQPANAVKLVESGHVDTVQVIYNVFDQSPEDELFPAVEAAGVGVIVRVPFDEGSLTGSIRPDTEFPDGDSVIATSRATARRRCGSARRRSPPTWESPWTSSRRSRFASASRTRPSRRRSPGCARCATSSGTSPRSSAAR